MGSEAGGAGESYRERSHAPAGAHPGAAPELGATGITWRLPGQTRRFERGLSGDVGARHLIGGNAEVVVEVEMDDEAVLIDIDSPAALTALTKASKS